MKTQTQGRQPALPVCIPPARSAFTLIELLVVITIIAVLAIIALPVYAGVMRRAAQAKDLANGRQIALALRLYSADHGGIFPSYTLQNGQPSTTAVSDSNTAFAQLIPAYMPTEQSFWLAKSKFCSANPPDNYYDVPALDTPIETLKSGENNWAYVLGLGDTSSPSVPLLLDGLASATSHTYVKTEGQKGGVWDGQSAVVINADSSASVEQIDQSDMTIHGSNGSQTPGDILTTANSDHGWLNTSNVVVNPK